MSYPLHCHRLIPKHLISCVDYCNSLTTDIPVSAIDPPTQSVLNTAASAILLKHKADHTLLHFFPQLPSPVEKKQSLSSDLWRHSPLGHVSHHFPRLTPLQSHLSIPQSHRVPLTFSSRYLECSFLNITMFHSCFSFRSLLKSIFSIIPISDHSSNCLPSQSPPHSAHFLVAPTTHLHPA